LLEQPRLACSLLANCGNFKRTWSIHVPSYGVSASANCVS